MNERCLYWPLINKHLYLILGRSCLDFSDILHVFSIYSQSVHTPHLYEIALTCPSPNYSLILLCFSLTSQNHNITISIIYWNNKRAFVWLYEGWSTVLFFFKKKEIYLVHLLFIFWKYNIKFIIADLHFIFIKNINHKRPLITNI